MRPVYADAGGSGSIDKIWSDFVSKLVVEVREEGVACTRSNVQYKKRQVPDIPEIKEFLLW